MAALNIDFTDAELEALREAAGELGVPMKALVKAATADHIAHHKALRAAAAVFQQTFADPALAAAIEAAGIDDGPALTSSGRAA